MSKKHINIYELNLSDEHMGHVYRFLGLGKFDRAQHEWRRGYINWKVTNKRAMDARDAAARAAPPDHEPASDDTQRPRPAR